MRLTESSTTGGADFGLAELCALPPLAPESPTTGDAPFGYMEWLAVQAQMRAQDRRARWVNPQVAARALPRTARPSRAGRLVVAGRTRQGRRAPSRAGPDGDDPEPAGVGLHGAGGRS